MGALLVTNPVVSSGSRAKYLSIKNHQLDLSGRRPRQCGVETPGSFILLRSSRREKAEAKGSRLKPSASKVSAKAARTRLKSICERRARLVCMVRGDKA